jgi:DNA-binding CsgD family transcriptional regulator
MPSNLRRTIFVGREAELRRLRGMFDAAAVGEGMLAFVVGEPGIGKTALCGELARYAEGHGGQALTGHCYEEGSQSLPYLPFVEALRGYAFSVEPEALRRALGAGAAEVARIIPELRTILQVAPEPPTDPESDHYRLLEAVTTSLRTIAAGRPLALILEDLHDADRGTLDLLTHLTRRLAGARLLVVGTYRDVEVDRAHPLSGALAELRRAAPVERLRLGGLSADETAAVVLSIAGEEAPRPVVEALYRQTEGNPLFVHEAARYLVEERGTLGKGATGDGTSSGLGIPEGLRDVIGKRLSRLSPECNRLLGIAAIIGREFELETLLRVSGADEEAVLDALDEAVGGGVLEEQERAGTARYRFGHALVRQTLYEELRVARRIRLHQQVARVLEERHAHRLDEHAAALAEHFAHSSDPADLAQAVAYAERAAQAAMAVFAYGEAARLLGQALDVQEVLDSDDRARRCDLLLAHGEALTEAGEPRYVLDHLVPEAFALAEALGDEVRAARAGGMAFWALYRERHALALLTQEAVAWVERLDRYAAPETLERAKADLWVGAMRCYGGAASEGLLRLSRALDLARRLDSPDTLWMAAANWIVYASAPQHATARLTLAEELLTRPRAGARPMALGWGVAIAGHVLLEHGQRERTETAWAVTRALAEHSGHANLVLLAPFYDAILATMDGRLDEAVTVAERIAARGEELGLPDAARVLRCQAGTRALLWLGRADEALRFALPVVHITCLAHAGRMTEATTLLDERVVRRPGVATDADETRVEEDTLYLEAAVLAGHREAAALLYRRLADSRMITTGATFSTCPARHLGGAAALLGDRAAAQAWYERALADAERVGFRPEAALTRLALADLLLEGPPVAGAPSPAPSPNAGRGGEERAQALAYLDFAIPEFEAMQMQPSLERAMRLRERASGQRDAAVPATGPAAPDGLTAREVEVLGLLAAGQTNQEIADRLVLSLRTVERHTVNIYAKIGARGRAEAVAYALRHDLGASATR